MKLTLIPIIMLIALCAPAYAQNSLVEALANSNASALAESRPERLQDQIHKDLVIETITAAQRSNVHIDREAASLLDQIYREASERVAQEPEGSPQRKLFPANQTRFIARLISLAEPLPEGARIIPETIQRLKKELRDRVAGFCPCFPFC